VQSKVAFIWTSYLFTVASLCACGQASPMGGDGVGTAAPVAVDNRVKVGDNIWIFEPGNGEEIVRAGAIESFEVVNDTEDDILPVVELNKALFKKTFDGCGTPIKRGQSCLVRGEWLEGGARKATLEVTVTKQNAPGAAKESISVPLEASSTTGTPAGKSISPTPASTSPSPSPSATSTTGAPTPSRSTTGTSTPSNSAKGRSTSSTSPGRAPSTSATLGGSSRR
jgi:hypothetical protein